MAGTQILLHRVNFFVGKRCVIQIITVMGRSWNARLGSGLVPTPRQGRQERNGAWRGGEGDDKTESVEWRACGALEVEGPSTLQNCNANVSVWISEMEMPLHFPPNTLSKEGDADSFLLWVSRRAWGTQERQTAHSKPVATGGQEAITRVRPLRGFVKVLGWNLDWSRLQNLEVFLFSLV